MTESYLMESQDPLQKQKKADQSRKYELDWLRVTAVLVLVFFHSSEIFSGGWFHIKNTETSYFFNVLSGFIYLWHMPLFFLISGASTWFALEFRTEREYRKERIVRLFIPLVFGILLLIPPQSYFENIQKAGFRGSFPEFYPHFFNGIYPSGNLHWGHLWFLFYLLVFSLVSVKLFVSFKVGQRQKFRKSFANRFSRGHSIFKLVVPLIFIEVVFRWLFPGFQTFVTDWANVFHYLYLFVLGYLLYSEKSLLDGISANMKLALIVAIPLSISYLVVAPLSQTAFDGFMANPTSSYLLSHPETVLYYILLMVLKVTAEWCWLIVLLGYGRKLLSYQKRGIRVLSRFAFPFYIFHQTVVITIGFHVVQLSLHIGLKYLIVVLGAIPIIYICCLLTKTNRITRFMFGMK